MDMTQKSLNMVEKKPTLREVQSACFKDTDCVVMGAYRHLSTRITRLLFNTPLLPWHITLISFAIAVCGAGLFLMGGHAYLVAGAVLLQVSFILDCVDGEIGRLKGTGSPFGAWLDPMVDYFSTASFIGTAAIGQFFLSRDTNFLIVGIAALANFGMVSLMIPTRARYLGKSKIKPITSAGKKKYIGNRSLSVSIITIGALLNQLFYTLLLFATVWALFWVKMVIDFYNLTKKWGRGKKQHIIAPRPCK
jgi:phosphatidylglycerophosphate synthase